jgi:peptide/nickel transport system permease protein
VTEQVHENRPAEPERTKDSGDGELLQSESVLRLNARVFMENRLAVVGVAMVIFFVLFCFVGPLFYHTNQVSTNLNLENQPPSVRHVLGTDNVGYDLLGRLMAGGQTTITVGLVVAILATTFGVIWGAVAGFAGGLLDSFMMRIVDTLLAVPTLFLLLFLATIFEPDELLLIVVIAGIAWLVPSRLIRAETLTVRTRAYVESAVGQGAGSTRIIVRHLIPNALGTIVVNATFQVADAVLTVAALSFLGLGIPPPAANWGSMLSDGVNFIFLGYWWQVWPAGFCIVMLVIAFNFIGDGLRDAFDVRLQRR